MSEKNEWLQMRVNGEWLNKLKAFTKKHKIKNRFGVISVSATVKEAVDKYMKEYKS